MMSVTFGLFTQVSGSGPLGPLVVFFFLKGKTIFYLKGTHEVSQKLVLLYNFMIVGFMTLLL